MYLQSWNQAYEEPLTRPSLTWAKIQSLCLAETAYINVPALSDESWSYNPPSASGTACQCNTVSYSLMAGCTYCQWPKAAIPSEGDWSASCPSYDDQGLGFAESVEAIPAWAYHTWSDGTWAASVASTNSATPTAEAYGTTLSRSFSAVAASLTSASGVATTSRGSTSVAGAGSSESSSSADTTTSASTATSTATSGASSKSSTDKWAPAVGGIAGAMVLLGILIAGWTWYRRRRRRGTRGGARNGIDERRKDEEVPNTAQSSTSGAGGYGGYPSRSANDAELHNGGDGGGDTVGIGETRGDISPYSLTPYSPAPYSPRIRPGLASPGLGRGGYGPNAVGTGTSNAKNNNKKRKKGKKGKKERIAYPYANQPQPQGDDGTERGEGGGKQGRSFLDMIVGDDSQTANQTRKGKQDRSKKMRANKDVLDRGGQEEKRRSGTSSFFAGEAPIGGEAEPFSAPRTAPKPPITPLPLHQTSAKTPQNTNMNSETNDAGRRVGDYAVLHRQSGVGHGPHASLDSSVIDLADLRARRQSQRHSHLSERYRGLTPGSAYVGRSSNPGLEIDFSSHASSASSPSPNHSTKDNSIYRHSHAASRQLLPPTPLACLAGSRDFSAPPSAHTKTQAKSRSRIASDLRTLPSLYEPYTGAAAWTQSMMDSPMSQYPAAHEHDKDRRASEGTIGAALGSGARTRDSYWGESPLGEDPVPDIPSNVRESHRHSQYQYQ